MFEPSPRLYRNFQHIILFPVRLDYSLFSINFCATRLAHHNEGLVLSSFYFTATKEVIFFWVFVCLSASNFT